MWGERDNSWIDIMLYPNDTELRPASMAITQIVHGDKFESAVRLSIRIHSEERNSE